MTNVMTVKPNKAIERLMHKGGDPVHFKGLIYADFGVGKTYQLCMAPTPILLILSEWAVAMPTVNAVKKLRGLKDSDIVVLKVNSWEDYMTAYAYAKANVHNFKTIGVDGLTDINQRAKEEVYADSVAMAKRNSKEHIDDALEYGDWNKVGNRTIYGVRLFRDLPCDVLFTALAQDIAKEMVTTILVQPKHLLRLLPSYFNLVGYLTTEHKINKPSIRKLQVEPTVIIQAKNPGSALPPVIENPDMGVIIPQVKKFLEFEQLSVEGDTTNEQS